jgi:phosphate transport system substrate-binding protein
VLAAIYRGRVRRWNDPAIAALNPDLALPAANITAVHRTDASGTTFLLSRYLAANDPGWRAELAIGTTLAWPAGVRDAAGEGNEGVASLVQRTRWSIGYVEHAYARRHGLADVVLPAHDGPPVRASRESFEAAAAAAHWRAPADLEQSLVDEPGAASWPIVGASFVLVPDDSQAPRSKEAMEFFRWALSEGDAAAAELGYVPLPAPARALVDGIMRGAHADPGRR